MQMKPLAFKSLLGPLSPHYELLLKMLVEKVLLSLLRLWKAKLILDMMPKQINMLK